MGKYVLAILVVLVGIFLLLSGEEEKSNVSVAKTTEKAITVESLPQETTVVHQRKKKKEVNATLVRKTKEVEQTEETIEVQTTLKKRKLLGGADVYFIEPDIEQAPTKFGHPPR